MYMFWPLLGGAFFLAAFIITILVYVRLQQNRYISGKEIPPERLKQTRWRYLLIPIFLFGLSVLLVIFPESHDEEMIVSEVRFSRMSFDEFMVAYNYNADFLGETFSEWTITLGELYDTAWFDGIGYAFRVVMTRSLRDIILVNFFFASTEDVGLFNFERLVALVRTIEPSMTRAEASQFLAELTDAMVMDSGLTSPSNATYQFFEDGGISLLRIDLPVEAHWAE